jgi:hypothetical protein
MSITTDKLQQAKHVDELIKKNEINPAEAMDKLNHPPEGGDGGEDFEGEGSSSSSGQSGSAIKTGGERESFPPVTRETAPPVTREMAPPVGVVHEDTAPKKEKTAAGKAYDAKMAKLKAEKEAAPVKKEKTAAGKAYDAKMAKLKAEKEASKAGSSSSHAKKSDK